MNLDNTTLFAGTKTNTMQGAGVLWFRSMSIMSDTPTPPDGGKWVLMS